MIRRFNEGAFSAGKIDIWPEELLAQATHIDKDTVMPGSQADSKSSSP